MLEEFVRELFSWTLQVQVVVVVVVRFSATQSTHTTASSVLPCGGYGWFGGDGNGSCEELCRLHRLFLGRMLRLDFVFLVEGALASYQ